MLLSLHLHPSRFSSSPRTAATFLMSAMHTTPTPNPSTAADHHVNQAMLYHEETKHHLTRYARGPHGLDWANQPNPFLRYTSSPILPLLHFPSPSSSSPYYPLFNSIPVPPQPLTYSTLSSLLYDSLSLSAWKSTGFSTWSLRVNPSSGNLHPTECYIVSPKLPKEESSDFGGNGSLYFDSTFVAHYAPQEHSLELRSVLRGKGFGDLGLPKDGSFVVGLSSVFWREAWKYGERAFRYCNHDVGHAIGALVIAAASVGWEVTILDGLGQEDLRSLFGIGFGFDVAKPEFLPSRPVKGRMPWIEMEHPDCALLVFPARGRDQERLEEAMDVDYIKLRSEITKLKSLEWFGKPNSLSKDHICWDIIYKTAEAVEKLPTSHEQFKVNPFHSSGLISEGLYKDYTVREVVRKRRSAVDMDGVHVMSRETFYQILLHCLPSGELGSGEKQGKQLALPFKVLPWDSEVHAALFVHRVKELPRGLYFLVRNEDHFDLLKRTMRLEFEWEKPEGCPVGLPLYRLTKGDCRDVAKTLSCHQDIAADGCFSLGMIARFEPTLRQNNAWMYPRLFWETGILGQVLYLEAHAVGISATGIGCYFDDAVHEVLGLKGKEFQSLYHFTVGSPVVDRRITSLPAYPGPQVDA